jgi:hypothetical protein
MDAQTHTTDIVGTSETVNFTVDLLAPTVSFNQTFENSTFRTSNVTMALVFNKPVSQIIYCLDSQSNATADGNPSLSISNLSNGEHSLTVYAKDNYGVISKPRMISFNVKVPEPFPTPTIISIILVVMTIVAAASVGLLNYRKRKRSRKFD